MNTLIKVLRWTARTWSVGGLLLVLAMLTGEADPRILRLPPRELVGLLFFPTGVAAGLLLAFRNEQAGGWMSIASLAAFYIWHFVESGDLPRGPYFVILAAPGAMFLVCSRLTERIDRGTAIATHRSHDLRGSTAHSRLEKRTSPPQHSASDTAVQPDLRAQAAIVVTSEHHGNTRKVATAMAAGLGAPILAPEQVSLAELSKYELVGFGSGIYFGQHGRSLRKIVNSLDSVPRCVFIFSTAGLPWLSYLFHWPLRRALKQRGGHVVGEFSCRGWDTVGPLFLMGGINRRHPDGRDLDRATSFADGMARACSSTRPESDHKSP
ncbi:MAG: flavodoxin family protein [Planctomycetaceae bacterium]